MARTTKKKETAAPVVTRAEKKDAVKNLIKELLAIKPYRHNELLDEAAKLYAERWGGKDAMNVNDVKGRIGSVLDVMKKDGDVGYEGGMYALKARLSIPTPQPEAEEKTEEKPKKTRAKKTEKPPKTSAEVPAEEQAEKPKKTRVRKTEKKEEAKETSAEESSAPQPEAEEKPAPKKRGRKPKTAEVKKQEKEEPKTETAQAQPPQPELSKTEEKKEENTETPAENPQASQPETETQENALVIKERGEMAKKDVMDVSFLLGITPKTPAKPTAQTDKASVKENAELPKTEESKERKGQETQLPAPPSTPVVPQAKTTAKPQPQPQNAKPAPAPLKRQAERKPAVVRVAARTEKPLTADEKLKESFLKKLRSLGGDYFEYYSVYLLERYSMKNGRRLEGLKISGGDHDGGIDGELELTDALGFKETLYVQSKNWNPEKGDEKLWVVGETLLQQFIGACACRQAKDGKQSCRGVFITTSRFTPEARKILERMGEKIVGYDGNDLYEAAKECAFGIVKKNGEWALDEKLLSGTKAFFNLY